MITGKIDENLDAHIEIEVLSESGQQTVKCVLHTGFNGFLSLPMPLIDELGLSLGPVQSGITADGKTGYFDTAYVNILWLDGQKSFQAQVLDEALVGTRLLRGLRMVADWWPDGDLVLSKLSA